MALSRVRRPETVTLDIAGGDTVTVKRFLTAKEFRALIRAATKPVRLDALTAGQDVPIELDPTDTGLAVILAYLLDWSFTDYDGRPIVIRDQPPAVVQTALDMLDADSYMELQRVIQDHDTTTRAFLAAEKKSRNGSTPPDPTS